MLRHLARIICRQPGKHATPDSGDHPSDAGSVLTQAPSMQCFEAVDFPISRHAAVVRRLLHLYPIFVSSYLAVNRSRGASESPCMRNLPDLCAPRISMLCPEAPWLRWLAPLRRPPNKTRHVPGDLTSRAAAPAARTARSAIPARRHRRPRAPCA
jgi:hypothetical protein